MFFPCTLLKLKCELKSRVNLLYGGTKSRNYAEKVDKEENHMIVINVIKEVSLKTLEII